MATSTRTASTDWGTALVDVVTCDGCGLTAPKEGLVGWVTIDTPGVEVTSYGDPMLPIHACSRDCATTVLGHLSWLAATPRTT